MPTDKFISDLGHNKDVRAVKGHTDLVDNTLIGVEVELENMLLDDGIISDYWKVVADGSLKNNGHEFVFNQPLGGEDAVTALSELQDFIMDNGYQPDISERTSVHVHIDIRDLNLEQYKNFIGLYLVFETSLFHYCGKGRDGNCFSVPWSKLDSTVFAFADARTNGKMYNMIGNLERNKYTSINLGSTGRFGSIEFRGHGGEWRKEKLLIWINLLLSLKKYILYNEINWDELLPHISRIGSIPFTDNVFGAFAKYIDYPQLEYDVIQGVRLAQDAVYSKDIQNCYRGFGFDEDGERKQVSTKTMSSNFKKYVKKHGGRE